MTVEHLSSGPQTCGKYFTHDAIALIFRDTFDDIVEGVLGCYWHLKVEVQGCYVVGAQYI